MWKMWSTQKNSPVFNPIKINSFKVCVRKSDTLLQQQLWTFHKILNSTFVLFSAPKNRRETIHKSENPTWTTKTLTKTFQFRRWRVRNDYETSATQHNVLELETPKNYPTENPRSNAKISHPILNSCLGKKPGKVAAIRKQALKRYAHDRNAYERQKAYSSVRGFNPDGMRVGLFQLKSPNPAAAVLRPFKNEEADGEIPPH